MSSEGRSVSLRGRTTCSAGSHANVDPETSGYVLLPGEVSQQIAYVGTVESQVALFEYDCIRGLDPTAHQHLEVPVLGVRFCHGLAVVQHALLPEPIDDVGAAADIRRESVIEKGEARIGVQNASAWGNGVAHDVTNLGSNWRCNDVVDAGAQHHYDSGGHGDGCKHTAGAIANG